jgi:hypothetical protein
MRNIINISISLLFLVCVLFGGCASSKMEEKSYYRSEIIDSILKYNNGKINAKLHNITQKEFKEYYLMDFCYFINKNNLIDTVFFIVLSPKNNEKLVDTNIYDKLNIGIVYNLNLFSIDSLVNATLLSRTDYAIVYNFNEIIYSRGKFRIKVYFSNYISGEYILKNR